MTFPPLPDRVTSDDGRSWQSFQPYFDELQQRAIDPAGARQWLRDWSATISLLDEAISLIYIEKSQDTRDEAREQAFFDFLENVDPQAEVADQALKERLLGLDLLAAGDGEMADMRLVLRNLRTEAELFREENIPLMTALAKLDNEYDKITGGMKVDWEGEEKNLSQLEVFLKEHDRPTRQRAWLAIMDLWQGSRPQIDEIYSDMLGLRRQVANNAGFADYRAYAFRAKKRFDYTPEDCLAFHDAIEAAVVPAASRIYARKRQRLGLESLRPWDVEVEPGKLPRLKPYQEVAEFVEGSQNIFSQVDPQLGEYFAIMVKEKLLDLETRPGKALGGFCATLALRQRPFIFMNGVGLDDDVRTLLHEGGHAFHVFEMANLPLYWQTQEPMEFAEVASMSMELLAAPYLTREYGGFYTASESARARIEHLEGLLTFLPYMAVVDAFQHWVYTHPDEAAEPANRDAAWDRLWLRFMPGIDYGGYEEVRVSGWQRKQHIFSVPFYYVEYGIAQVGALQVWRNALQDQAQATAAYRRALSLGGMATLPELFAAAGAEFRLDESLLSELVALVEETIAQLESER